MGKIKMQSMNKTRVSRIMSGLKRELPILPGYILMVTWTVFIFFVIGWIILASLSTTREVFTGQLLASGVNFANFTRAFFQHNGFLHLVNSMIYTAPSVTLIILVCAPAAYCMSRYTFWYNKPFLLMLLIGLAIPNVMIIMPLFSIISWLDMSGSRWTMIFLYTTIGIPFSTFFLIAFFKGISISFEEAAAIDGCGPIKTFWLIMLPLARPAIMTLTIFNFISRWNEYFLALVFANRTELRPVGVGLRHIVVSLMTSGDWAGMFASVVIAFVPTVVIYIFLANKIISGVTSGGIKG